jgi:metal-responsive CopG/Arc/MetJ family transcriptional regulator
MMRETTMTKTEEMLTEMKTLLDSERTFGMYVKAKKMKSMLVHLEDQLKVELDELIEYREWKNQLIDQAHEEASVIRRKAEEEVYQQNVTQKANQYAKQIVEKAEYEANNTIAEAKEKRKKILIHTHSYIDNLLDGMEKGYSEQKDTLSKNREALRISLVEEMELDVHSVGEEKEETEAEIKTEA